MSYKKIQMSIGLKNDKILIPPLNTMLMNANEQGVYIVAILLGFGALVFLSATYLPENLAGIFIIGAFF